MLYRMEAMNAVTDMPAILTGPPCLRRASSLVAPTALIGTLFACPCIHPTIMKGMHMDSVKARITGDGIDTSVEFSVEEVIAGQQGKPWGEMDDAHQQQTMKDYALDLLLRQDGIAGDLQVTLEGGTFSKVGEKDV